MVVDAGAPSLRMDKETISPAQARKKLRRELLRRVEEEGFTLPSREVPAEIPPRIPQRLTQQNIPIPMDKKTISPAQARKKLRRESLRRVEEGFTSPSSEVHPAIPRVTPPSREAPAEIPPRIPRRLTQQNRRTPPMRPAKIIIDNQNVPIPNDIDFPQFLNNIKRNMKKHGFQLGKLDFVNVDFDSKLWSGQKPESSRASIANTENLNVTLHWVTETDDESREDCDIEIMLQLLEYSLWKNPPYALVLVSADKDYIGLVERLRSTHGVELYMSAKTVSAGVVSRKPYFVEWYSLIRRPYGYSPMTPCYLTPKPRHIPSPLEDQSKQMLVLLDGDTCSALGLPFRSAGRPNHCERINHFLHDQWGCKAHSVQAFYSKDSVWTPLIIDLTFNAERVIGITQNPIIPPISKDEGERTPDMSFVDVEIMKHMYYWGLTKLPPAPMLVVSKDVRLARAVKMMRTYGFTVYVATDIEDAVIKESFEKTGAHVLSWN